jgi:hypothetical protein
MIGLFMLNGKKPKATARSPSRRSRRNPWVVYSNRKKGTRMKSKVKRRKVRSFKRRVVKAARKRFVARRRKGWRSESRAHAIAAKIGWTYRKYASDFRKFGAYAARATRRGKHKGLSISAGSLRRYRSGRRTPLRRLEGRREWYKHRTTKKRSYMGAVSKAKKRYGMLYNKSAYQKFIGSRVRGARGRADARRRFRAAVAAWKRHKRGGKSRRHRDNPVLPMSYSNGKRKRRRSRRNPVLPMSYSNRRGRKSRRKHRKNPLFRTSRGRFARRGGRRLRRIGGGGWHANRRRSYRNSPILPYTAFSNPVAALTGTVKEIANVDLWTRTILPLTGGYIGTHLIAYQGVKMLAPAGTSFSGIVKHGARAGAAVLLSAAVGIVTKDTDMAAKVLAGGLVALLGGVVSDLIGADYTKATGLGEMSDLADDLTEDLKARIAQGVRQQFSGDEGDGSVSAFVTQEDLNRAPHLGDFVTSEALNRATVGSGMAARAGGGPPRESSQALAGLETFQDALADGSLI